MVHFLAFLLISIVHLLHHGFTETTMTFMDISKPKGTVKTIKSDDGDLIDCVDIYKQIAFDNPLVNSLQVDLYLEEQMKRENSHLENKLVHGWHRNGDCPLRTVPILRSLTHQTTLFQTLPAIKTLNIIKNHEHAVTWTKKGVYFGASAKLSVWNPQTEKNDFSLSQLWLVNDRDTINLNSIEAGWMVNPNLYGDSQTRFFIYWTKDFYNQTGCYNLKCAGFVQTSRTFLVGSALKQISVYNKTLNEIQISISKDNKTGNWLLQLNSELIGYWPNELFTSLAANASHVSWGGEIYYRNFSGHHARTQMGSGHFAKEGYLKASHFRNLEVMVKKKNSNKWESPQCCLEKIITNPNCYSLNIPIFFKRRDWGVYFYYGGPGFSAKCP